MNLKINDKIKVIKGKDRGKTGQIIQVFPKQNKIVVDGVNKTFKHLRNPQGQEKGQRVEFWGPIAAGNAMLICPKCTKSVRVNHKILENKKKVRICNKCKEVIE